MDSFNGMLRDELLSREIFYTRTEAKVLIERWRREYNTFRPHSALGYRPPAPEAIEWRPPASASLHLEPLTGREVRLADSLWSQSTVAGAFESCLLSLEMCKRGDV